MADVGQSSAYQSSQDPLLWPYPPPLIRSFRYKDDGLTSEDMLKLIERFPLQPLDFFGALRATTYDNQIRDWIKRDVTGKSCMLAVYHNDLDKDNGC